MDELSRRDTLKVMAGVIAGVSAGQIGRVEARTNKSEKLPISSKLPLAYTPNSTVLFQGDSITDGGRWQSGEDYNHIMGQDYCYIIAGEIMSQFPEAHLTFLNRGVSGNTVHDLLNRWQADTLQINPSLLSILVGVNDAAQTMGKLSSSDAGAQYELSYAQLIDQTLSANPKVKIVICQPFVLPVGARISNFTAWKDQVGAMQNSSEQLSVKYKLPYVRYGDMMTAACERASPDNWSWDGIHPTYAGHFLMHSLWLETVHSFYGEQK
jgi:lysophospholipase L1-like esterase